ncbi:hypothetical protein UFOVP97_14 [uncultured Caudovirales phage]|uniref:Uncharacterized protein n=1 Tax=uncultured Caudovirales phage TaxID=2100421 RepID=A0A6J5LI05_9CAUD|nr:hypothetical protein UFOVP97_14 [uncultured Caudovirales phage]CAB4134228.1 hypothetical protein UFOVP268_32 [uncultured Caudovirales phage]
MEDKSKMTQEQICIKYDVIYEEIVKGYLKGLEEDFFNVKKHHKFVDSIFPKDESINELTGDFIELTMRAGSFFSITEIVKKHAKHMEDYSKDLIEKISNRLSNKKQT